jgi:hypothetical protein
MGKLPRVEFRNDVPIKAELPDLFGAERRERLRECL